MITREVVFEKILRILKELKQDGFSNSHWVIDEEETIILEEVASKNNVLPIIKYITKGGDLCFCSNCSSEIQNVKKLYAARFDMIKDLLNCFEKEGISYAILKGAYLGDIAYQQMGLRPSNDIDLLIKKEDIRRIKEICLKYNFIPGKSDRTRQQILHYSRRQELAFSINTHQIATMVKLGANEDFSFFDTVLDFNFSIFWGGYKDKEADLSDFFKRVKKIKDSNNYEYYVLDEADNLIQLCLHAYKEANGLFFVKIHEGLCLRAFLDIYYYIHEVEGMIDQDRFIIQIRKYGIEKYIYYIFAVIQELFGDNIWIHTLIDIIAGDVDSGILTTYGLTEEKLWTGISIKERFYSEKVSAFLTQNITGSEMEQIKIASSEFY